MNRPAVLVLADGSVFHGVSVGYEGHCVGELVFNTAMTGYQEVLTDPSYAQQIVTFTFPHIGNVGMNADDAESRQPWVAGMVIRQLSPIASNWRSEQSLSDYLTTKKIIAIAGIDTRELTHVLRDQGAQAACIMTGEVDEQRALALARAFPGLENKDLAIEVTTQEPYTWLEGSYELSSGQPKVFTEDELPQHVVVYDFGVKRSILRLLVDRGCRLTVVPADFPVKEVLAMQPDGVLLSNGPGDPAACDYAIANTKQLLSANIPLLGICLGHQILALASGARTCKMKFGHHGANHPVQAAETGTVMITSQNHGFACAEEAMPSCLEVTHRSLFDNSIQGIKHRDAPAMGFQGHPEASPGPHDVAVVFDAFMQLMQAATLKPIEKNNKPKVTAAS